MTTDYDKNGLAEKYQRAKRHDWRARMETYSFLRTIGDARGLNVVDAACGEGHLTRVLAEHGADKVLGFDISEAMIALARQREADEPLGIEYIIHDARAPVSGQSHDLVVAAWLLVYARNRAELTTMCRGVASWIRPNGRFITIVNNPALLSFPTLPDFRKYGFSVTLPSEAIEGAPIVWTVHLEHEEFTIENYFLPLDAFEESLSAAGFVDVSARPMELEPSPTGVEDRAYWADLLEYPTALLISARKDGNRGAAAPTLIRE